MALSHQTSPKLPNEAISKALQRRDIQLAAPEVITYVNEAKDSNVLSVSIPQVKSHELPTLIVQFSTQTNATVYMSYEITEFMKKALLRKSIDEAFHVKVAAHFQNLNFRFEKKPLIEQNDITALYKKIHKTLIQAKNAAQEAGQPLLILAGEYHTENYSLLCELIILDILKPIGLKNVFWEIPEIVPFVYYDDPDSSLIYKYNLLKQIGLNITPIEDTLTHSYLLNVLSLFNLFQHAVPEEVKPLRPLVDKLRNKAMVAKMLTTIPVPVISTKDEGEVSQEDKNAVIQGLARKFTEALEQRLQEVEKAVKERSQKSLQSSDIHMGIVGSEHLVIGDDVDLKSSYYVFWISTWLKKEGLSAHGQHFTNAKECNHLTHLALSEMVAEARKQYLEEASHKVKTPLQALSTFSESKQDTTKIAESAESEIASLTVGSDVPTKVAPLYSSSLSKKSP